MAIVSAGIANQAQLDKIITKAIRKLGKQVVRVSYSFESDWSGDPSIYFRVV